MQSFFLSSFFLNIFLVLLYSSFLAAIVGSIMQMGRLSSMAGSISHTILAGVGLATWLGFFFMGRLYNGSSFGLFDSSIY